MLECYADDSGTHDGSSVIVWGGILGDQQVLAEFEQAWNKRLQSPCDDKPPLKKGFHSSHLAMGLGEFLDYNQAERDHTRYTFKQLIIEAGLSWVSYGVSRMAYEECCNSYFNRPLIPVERLPFGTMLLDVCDAAHAENETVTFLFDKAREPYVAPIIPLAIEESKINDDLVSYGFSSVKNNAALQAADLVAHETYRYFTKYINDPEAKIDIHLQQLVEGAYDCRWAWFGKKELERIFIATEKAVKEAIKKAGGHVSSDKTVQKYP